MEDVLLEMAKNIPVVAVLLFWVNSERKERLETIAHYREQSQQHMRIVLSLVGKDTVG